MVNPVLQEARRRRQGRPAVNRAFAGLAALLLAVGSAEAAVPLPKLRPADLSVRQTPAVPLPRLRPPREAPAPPAQKQESAEPPEAPAESGTTTAAPPASPAGKESWSEAALSEAREACRSLLAGRDIAYTPLPAIGGDGGCGSPAPIEVTRIGSVDLTPSATISCPLAKALDDWLKSAVQPAAKARMNTQVTKIHVAASYVCRRRNNAASGKLSEHGKANALDMAGFSFAKQKDAVVGGGGWGSSILGTIGVSRSGSFLGDIRKDACSYFTTVLGPGSDPYHGSHFHVDVLERRGGYRICQ